MTSSPDTPDAHLGVVLVDDDALVRAGLKMILGGEPDIDVVGEAADGHEGLEVIASTRPDVVLMDIRMPVLDGIETTRRLLATAEPPQVIVLTTFDADDLVVQALQVGAAGFLLKDTRPERLVSSVRAVAAGEPVLSPDVTRRLMDRVTSTDDGPRRSAARTRLEALTHREHDVALLIAEGRSNADIAKRLLMSVPTVKAHVSSVLSKLGADNRVQVAIVVHDAKEG